MDDVSTADASQWKGRLSRAQARRVLAEADFYVTIAELADDVPSRDIERALGTSPQNVSEWIARGRDLGRVPAGQVGRDPYEIAQRYTIGEITREQMIDALSRWDYVPLERNFDLSDDIGVLDEGTFYVSVGNAFHDGLISVEDYDAILSAMSSADRR